MATVTDAPMCHICGHFFNDDPKVGDAHLFLYGRYPEREIPVRQYPLHEALEEVVLDMGNDTPDKAAAALAYALVRVGWPEPEDIQAAVLHHWTHQEAD